MPEHLSFSLPGAFLKPYKKKQPNWGFDIGAGNTLGELTYITKYSRLKSDGNKERWWETCQRVVEGYYSILKDHCKANRTPWNEFKAQKAAEDAYSRLWAFKWTPPGRGLQQMGTELVNADRNSGPLLNCAFLTTASLSSWSARSATGPFTRLMEMSMNGIGVGFDVRGAGGLDLHQPLEETTTFVVPDTREGWAESLGVLLETFFFKNRKTVIFDYSEVRPEGAPLKKFGGRASGPGPLKATHDQISALLSGRVGEPITSRDIVDIMNLAGKAVVAGGSRRSAELALGSSDDEEFITLKDWTLPKNEERFKEFTGWGNLSNNTILANGEEIPDSLIDSIALNGEPGIYHLDLARTHGRLIDGQDDKDLRAVGLNPCAEAILEDSEVCNLTELFPANHDDVDDFKQSLKHAYLYCKAVTLLPTPWPETNEVLTRNRRIGTSISGVVQFVEKHGWNTLREWADAGYKTIQERDRQYSEWLGIRESIRSSVVKPSGTVSILCGATPGVHWPVASGGYIRRQRFAKHDPMIELFEQSGYLVEQSVSDKGEVVVEFPVTDDKSIRTEREVSIWEKVSLAVLLQRYWADQAVSATFSFCPEEESQIRPVLSAYGDQLKTLSFLPLGDAASPGAYAQMPYEALPADYTPPKIKPIDWDVIYNGGGVDVVDEAFCSNDTCEVPV